MSRLLVTNVCLAAVYFLAGKLGLSLAFVNERATAVWPPSGIAIAALLLGGVRLAPGVFIGAFMVNVTASSGSIGSLSAEALLIAAGNTAESIVAAVCIRVFARGNAVFDRPYDALRYLAITGFSAGLAATIGATVLMFFGSAASFSSVWVTWWCGDLVGALILAPLIIAWRTKPFPRLTSERLWETAALLGATVYVAMLVFGGWIPTTIKNYPLHFLGIPLLLWSAFRFLHQGMTLFVFVFSALALWGTLRNLGPFASANPNEALLLLQSFLGTISATGLVLVGVIQDRQTAQQNLRVYHEIFNRSIDAIAVIRTDGTYLEQNPAHEALLGYSAAELVNQTPAIHLGQEGFTRIAEELTQHGFFRGEVSSRSKEGRPLTIELAAFAVGNEKNEPAFFVGIKRDVTVRNRAEQELKKTRQQLRSYADELERRVAERTSALKESNEQMEAFCYSIAHDLRAPLRAIQGFTNVLLEDYSSVLDSQGRDFAARVHLAAQRMDRLIQDLLEYSRIGRMDVALEECSLDAILDSALGQLPDEITTTHAEIVRPNPLPHVVGNRLVLEQVLLNLLNNAMKFVSPGVLPRIEIGATENGGRAKVYVRDNGIGIERVYLERIFRVFERLHDAETYPGTGIGLAIVKKGIERMGGVVGVESAPGKGSCFWFELPTPPHS